MKKFKTLLRNLHESGAQSFGGSVNNGFSNPEPRSAFNDAGIHYAYKNPQQLNRLNVFINSYLQGSYLDPLEPLKELAGKIAQMGLSFKLNDKTQLVAGENYLPIQVFGDKFGVTPTTDLSKGFDTGTDYPDMSLCFNLIQTKQGVVFADAHIKAGNDGAGGVEQEEPIQQNEEYNLFEEDEKGSKDEEKKKRRPKDGARVVEVFLSKDSDASKRILGPIYTHLFAKHKEGKYNSEKALAKFKYAVGAGVRTLANDGKIVTLSVDDSLRAANRLLKNFEKKLREED